MLSVYDASPEQTGFPVESVQPTDFFLCLGRPQGKRGCVAGLLRSKFRSKLLGPCRPLPFAPPRHCPAAGRQRPALKRLQRRPSKTKKLSDCLAQPAQHNSFSGTSPAAAPGCAQQNEALAHGWMTKGWIPSRCSFDSCNLAFLLSSASGLPPSIQPNLLAHLPSCCLLWGLTAGSCDLKKSRGIGEVSCSTMVDLCALCNLDRL